MKKTQLLMTLVTISVVATSLASCQEEKAKTASLDNYTIIETGKRQNVVVARVGLTICTTIFSAYGQENVCGYSFPNSFIFAGKNILTKEESKLFAEKYNYTTYLEDEISDADTYSSRNIYSTYCMREERSMAGLRCKIDSDKGSSCCLCLTCDVMEYTLTPKDTSKPDITIYGFVSVPVLGLEYWND